MESLCCTSHLPARGLPSGCHVWRDERGLEGKDEAMSRLSIYSPCMSSPQLLTPPSVRQLAWHVGGKRSGDSVARECVTSVMIRCVTHSLGDT